MRFQMNKNCIDYFVFDLIVCSVYGDHVGTVAMPLVRSLSVKRVFRKPEVDEKIIRNKMTKAARK